MRTALIGIFLASSIVLGQTMVDPAKLATVQKFFDSSQDKGALHCHVVPVAPRLSFSFRLQLGYVVRVPLKEYVGPGHALAVLTRVTPEGGRGPVYFASGIRLPRLPKNKIELEVGGTYLVGEGRYAVDWAMVDEKNRTCRKSWQAEAKLGSNERAVNTGMAPGTVGEVSLRRWSAQGNTVDDVRPIRRLTILLHAAPIITRMTRLRAQDRAILLASLVSLLESLPARSVRLVVFNLDQQKELFRQEVLTPEAFDEVAQSMNNLQLQTVDYRVLQNKRGHIGLLADLVNQELTAKDPSDAVIILGPTSRYYDKFLDTEIDGHASAAPRVFYLQYKPYWGRGADFPDSIEFATKKVRGKTMAIHTPDEFAKAIKQIEAQMTGGN